MQSWTLLNKEQKFGLVAIACFGLFAAGAGFLQLRNTIYNPFAISLGNPEQDLSRLFSSSELLLQQKDTDQDGLNDYEEITYYGTSAYLPDSDSDGVSDSEEIAAGTDPLCPPDQNCQANFDFSGLAARSTSSLELGLPGISAGALLGQIDDLEAEALSAINTSATGSALSGDTLEILSSLVESPTALREFLVSSGQISAEEAEKIGDDALVRAAREFLTEARENNSN